MSSSSSGASSTVAPVATRLFDGVALALITLAAVLHGVVILQAPTLQSANDRSRWCTVRSLLEEGSYRIDRVREIPGWDTIDLVLRDEHFYSTKPPLMSTWVAGVVWLIQQVTGWTFNNDLNALNASTLLVINAVPFIAGLVGLSYWLRRTVAPRTGILVLTAAAFGTLLSPFLTSLNNHTPAALGVLVGLLCWLRPAKSSRSRETLRFAIWGFAAAWAACHDLPALAFTAAMFLMAFREDARKALAVFLPAASIPLLAFLMCNFFALGSFVPAYSGYGGESYRFIHEGVPSYWLQPQGVDRNLDSPLVYFLNCTVGHHGWWLLTPLWLLALARPSRASGQHRELLWWTYLLSGVVLAFYLTRTGNYNYGGVSCGLRWAIFLTPLWLMALAIVLDQSRISAYRLGFVICCLAVSIFSAWYPMSRAWQQPWAYQLAENWGWTHPRPAPVPFDTTRYSWLSKLPELANPAEPTWVELECPSEQGTPNRLRLTLRADETIGARRCAKIEVEQTFDGTVERRSFLMDRDAFAAGQPVAQVLVWSDANVTPQQQLSDLAFVRGLPLLKAYHPGYERYLKIPLRRDAFACQRAAVQCDHSAEPNQPLARYRCDVWNSPEIPFGVARVDFIVKAVATGEVLRNEVWTVTACHPRVAPTTPVTVEMFDREEPIVPQLQRLQDSAASLSP